MKSVLACLAVTVLLQAAAQSQPARAERDGLAVVAPRSLWPALDAFCTEKAKELRVERVVLEEILERGRAETPSADDAEILKRHLWHRWKEGGLGYVLLVGDADVLPVRYMVLDRVTKEAFDFAFYPSDLYYGDVAKGDGAFEDWNGLKDGFHGAYYGEVCGEKNKDGPINRDGIDYVPELAVGRWPASTVDSVAAVAEKSLAFERAVREGRVSKDAAVYCASGWIDARAVLDDTLARLPEGWNARKRFYADAGTKASTPAPTEDRIVSDVADGAALLFHVGHGTDTAWQGCFDLRSIAKLGDGVPAPIFFSIGCTTARFATLPPYEAYEDASGKEHAGTNAGEVFTAPPPPPAVYARGRFNATGLGETLVRTPARGAVAYIGCNTGGQPCALTLLRGFVESLGNPATLRLGDAWRAAVATYHARERLAELKPDAGWYPPSIYFQAMKYMVYGDPSLRLPGGAPAAAQTR